MQLGDSLSRHFGSIWGGIAALYYFRYIIVGVVIALYERRFLGFLAGKSRFIPALLAAVVIATDLFRTPNFCLRTLMAATEPCICGLFVMWFVANPSRCAFLRRPVVQWFGACSYSIYLWQQLFTGPAFCYKGWQPSSAALCIIAIVLCAGLSHYLIERPGIRLGRILSYRRMGAKPVCAADVPEAV
jgi:peptidoglycan/LPS O-acetylase OafA/YrhL